MNDNESKVTKAFEFAYLKHKGGTRKTSGVPYIVHPMTVAIILMKNFVNEDLVIAGLLHDVVEDTGVTFSELQKNFGIQVTRLVKAVTEPTELKKVSDPRKTWKQRKQHTIDLLKSAEQDVRILSCADKLSNIRDLKADHAKVGEDIWGKFNAPKKEQEWYYRSLCSAFAYGQETITDLSLYQEFRDCVEQLFGKETNK
ncbi:MAG: HD domain-containing protein [Candidatus Heimdallarchaeota archaeon]|nr:MAG: HD domain-containing protein [Candidatus Heimdallarchaeota archaeon]